MANNPEPTSDNRIAVGDNRSAVDDDPGTNAGSTNQPTTSAGSHRRTRKRTATNQAPAPEATLDVEQPPRVGRKPRQRPLLNEQPGPTESDNASEPPKRKPRRKTDSQKLSASDAAQAAAALLEMVELFAVVRFGGSAAFAPQERLLIEPSLARIIERYGSVAQQFSWLADPAMLIIGCSMYAMRVAPLMTNRNDSPPPPPPPGSDDPPETPTDNGSNGVRPLSTDDLFSMVGGALQR